MNSYTVVGINRVAGVEPGGIVTAADLGDANVEALIAGGHIAPTKTQKPSSPAETIEE